MKSISPIALQHQRKRAISSQHAHLFRARFEQSEAVERLERLELVWRKHGAENSGRSETERKPFQYRVTLQHVERTQQNPYGLVVSSVEQNESLIG